MAETSEARIKKLDLQMEQLQREIETLGTMSIDDIAKEHPEWEEEAARRLQNHDWNLVAGEVDKEAH